MTPSRTKLKKHEARDEEVTYMQTYNKLVRDKIPSIIEADGKQCTSRILSESEFQVALKNKLIEEASELHQAKNNKDLIEELADVYEVLEEILIHENIDIKQIQKARVRKNMDKGGFDERIYLMEVK
jgi:predicted house-cleaning noncanonical NTP pyrophosphatase (MazG superfamily)